MAASAPGKLILFGEHAVVFGEPALSTAINLRAEVFVRPHREWLADGASLDEPRFRYVKKAVEKSNAPGPLWIEIRSMVPSGAGLGSSAAVTVATLGSLHSLAGSIDPPTIAREAFDVEHEVQGRASPIDTSTAAAGGGLLTELGVGHPALDRLVSAARPSSYGAKLTGAGGGGSMFALTDRPSKTAEAIRAAGGKSFVVQADSRGVAKIG